MPFDHITPWNKWASITTCGSTNRFSFTTCSQVVERLKSMGNPMMWGISDPLTHADTF